MPRRTWCWVVSVWLLLVAAGGAVTLYLDDTASPPQPPPHWERVSPPSGTPRPCPTPTGESPSASRGCAFWERS
ncbi:hypothetical protein ACWEPM_37760 [Streptomyces sp. NPDC004244]